MKDRETALKDKSKPDDVIEVQTEADEKPIVQVNNGNNARASWPISLHNLRNNIAHCRAEAKQVFVDCFLWCIQHDVTRAEFASEVSLKGAQISENVVYKIITGSYTHPNTKERLDISEKHLKAMAKWLNENRAIKGQALKAKEFVMTPTAKKVFLACSLARESKTPVFLYGPSHIGKTWALQYDAETNNHGRTVYIRCGAASGLGGLLSIIATRIGVSGGTSKEKMIKAIMGALVPDMTLILDEVHLLMNTYRKESFFACIEVIRELYDRVGLGLVLALTNLGRDKIETERRRELEQVFRRGVHRFQVGTQSGQPLKKDIELILAYHGLEFPKKKEGIHVSGICEQPYEIIHQLSKEEGLKAITERIRYAKKLCSKQSKELTWEDFVKAHLLIQQNATPAPNWN